MIILQHDFQLSPTDSATTRGLLKHFLCQICDELRNVGLGVYCLFFLGKTLTGVCRVFFKVLTLAGSVQMDEGSGRGFAELERL